MNHVISSSRFVFFAALYYWGIQPILYWGRLLGVVPSIPFTLILYILPVISTLFFWKKHTIAKHNFITIIVFLLAILYLLFDIVFLSNSKESLTRNVGVLVYHILAFVCGVFFPTQGVKKYRNLINTIWVISSVFWLLNADIGGAWTLVAPQDEKFNYLLISDGYVVLSLLTLSVNVMRNNIFTTLLPLFSIVVLFVINSRSALFIFILTFALCYLPKMNFKSKISFLIITLIIVIYLLRTIDLDTILDTRVFRLILNTEQDTSLMARTEILETEIDYLWNNWLFGDYDGYMERGGEGAYIHNYLSFWEQYGLVPFVCFCILSAISIKVCINLRFCRSEEGIWAIAILFYALSGCLTSKAYVYSTIWFSFGYLYSLSLFQSNNRVINQIKYIQTLKA